MESLLSVVFCPFWHPYPHGVLLQVTPLYRDEADFQKSHLLCPVPPVYYTPKDTHQTATLCVGSYKDTIVIENEEAKYLKKLAVVDTNVLPRYVIYPV